MIEAYVFYILSAILVAASIAVITVRNPVHAVLFLILCFFNAAGLFVMLGAEFVGMILAIVYVGAVAVLFLFVVMMLDISFQDLRKGAMQYVPLGLMIGAVLLAELIFLYKDWDVSPEAMMSSAAPVSEEMSNTRAIGNILYTDYVLAFQISGLVLFVAMIGAIVLTHRRRPGVRRQKTHEQVSRKREEAVEVRKVTSGTGV